MSFITPEQLATLAAVADTGGFERAAATLHVTTSAVSQRVRALETAVGQVLIRRGSPSRLTDAGGTVLRYARQMALLQEELRAELTADDSGGVDGPGAATGIDLPVAVNADSLATWFPRLFPAAAAWRGVRLRLYVEDEEHTAGLLRDGVAMAAVSTDAAPVAGCRATPLAGMTYHPLVAPRLLARIAHPASRTSAAGFDLGALPVVRYSDKDDLQDQALRAVGVHHAVPGPRVPNSQAYVAAVTAGLGWGMLPTAQVPPAAALVPVPGLTPVVRRLFWHCWKLDSPALRRLTEAVAAAATHADRAPAA